MRRSDLTAPTLRKKICTSLTLNFDCVSSAADLKTHGKSFAYYYNMDAAIIGHLSDFTLF